MAIQLAGRKRWFVSNDPPTLPNQWKGVGEAPPKLERYKTFDVGPGDLLYLPRGTAHTVQSTTESIHVSIGFVPVTLRDALIATIDHLSDLDMPLRAGVTPRADDLANDRGSDFVAQKVRAALQKLHANALADSFVADAMERRRSRMIADLPKIPPPTQSDGVTNLQTRLRHNPLAIAHAIKAGDVIDFSQPGEQIYIHAGAEQGLQFIVETPEFLVADIPGDIGDAVRITLVDRLLTSGFLCRAENEQFDLPQPASASFYA
jgi:ribosomal protein L16 Arg81 hydroxylase